MALMNLSKPSTAKPNILKGIDSNQTIGYSKSAITPIGQHTIRSKSHIKKVNNVIPLFA